MDRRNGRGALHTELEKGRQSGARTKMGKQKEGERRRWRGRDYTEFSRNQLNLLLGFSLTFAA